ncbi:MAG: penicillin-binding protein activator [bacterium]
MYIRFIVVFTLILTISGCQSTTKPTPSAVNPADRNGANLLARAVSSNNPVQSALYRTQAAEAFAFQNAYSRVIEALSPVNLSLLDAKDADQVRRLRARAWQKLDNLQAAETALAGLSSWNSEDQLILARICEEQGNFRCAADGYIQASITLGLDAPELPADIQDRIWQMLSRAQSAPGAFTHRYHHGWWLLQQNIRDAGSISEQIQAWQSWQDRYPSHPANVRPPRALAQLSSYQLPNIAFLLPLTGQYGSAGQAVRDGLIAAYLSDTGNRQPPVRFYDTGAKAAGQLYEDALANGADVIVGPLLRDEVAEFANATANSPVPRLVLNYLTPPGTPMRSTETASPLFQIGIAIEDEAATLVNHILLEGYENTLVIHSNERWARRALTAYADSWPHAMSQASFADIQDLTGAVGRAMQVAASETRMRDIANILGKPLEFLPRARGDLDAIVAFTNQVEAQALVPALRFHFADKLPVFATSQTARGDKFSVLDGFELTEMPLFTSPDEAQRQLVEAYTLQTNPLAELYALGFDAYRVATWLPLLSLQSQIALPGASGNLWLEPGGRFRRDLLLNKITASGDRVTR